MKILIIHPNKFAQRYVSVGVSMISAVLKEAGHNVVFFDTSRFKEIEESNEIDYSEKSVRKMKQVLQFKPVDLPLVEKSTDLVMDALDTKILSFEPDLIAFTATSSEFLYVIAIVKQIKKYNITTIVGGCHATVSPLEVLAVDGIDLVAIGEGEETILELVDSMDRKENRTDIANIYFKTKSGIIRNKIRPYNQDLDSLPFMDLDIFDKYHHIGAYQGKIVKYARIETGRGCPFECTYCINATYHDTIYNYEHRHVRTKSPKRVIDELRFYLEKVSFNIIRFVDETFTAYSIEWLNEFVKLYKTVIKKPMIIATRPERVTYPKMKILREAHKYIQVTMGIESGSERIRREVLNRKMSNNRIKKAYELCHELGFNTAAFNMIGLPSETREDFIETIQLNREINTNTPMLSYFYPFKGSKLRDECISNGYIDDVLHEVDYSVSSVLRLPDFSLQEIEGLKRTFVMYVKMDESMYPEIKKAEQNDDIFNKLVEIYNKQILSKGNNK